MAIHRHGRFARLDPTPEPRLPSFFEVGGLRGPAQQDEREQSAGLEQASQEPLRRRELCVVSGPVIVTRKSRRLDVDTVVEVGTRVLKQMSRRRKGA